MPLILTLSRGLGASMKNYKRYNGAEPFSIAKICEVPASAAPARHTCCPAFARAGLFARARVMK